MEFKPGQPVEVCFQEYNPAREPPHSKLWRTGTFLGYNFGKDPVIEFPDGTRKVIHDPKEVR